MGDDVFILQFLIAFRRNDIAFSHVLVVLYIHVVSYSTYTSPYIKVSSYFITKNKGLSWFREICERYVMTNVLHCKILLMS